MPRLTYLYVRHRNYPLHQMQTDGHYNLMQQLVKKGMVSSARIIRENYAIQKTILEVSKPDFECWSVPDLNQIELEEDEIVWVRGGWKPWLPWIERHMSKHWFIYYAANTGHHPWPHWDVVLEDTRERAAVISKTGALLWHFRKPVSPDFKVLDPPENNVWDVCCGASHIYDRKGQYRILGVAEEFKRLTGRDLRVVMPGSFLCREKNTEAMKAELRTGKHPYIHLPGMVDRKALVKIFNQSTFMYAATCGGQGDRCALESAICGCRQIIALAKNHAPYIYGNSRYAFVQPHQDDLKSVARYLAKSDTKKPSRRSTALYYDLQGGIERVTWNLTPLFQFIVHNKKDRDSLKRLTHEV